MTISTGDIDALVQMFEQSKWKELELQVGDVSLFLGKDADGHASWDASKPALPPAPAAARPAVANAPAAAPAKQPSPASVKPADGTAAVPEGCVVVSAPSLGTFYRSAKPGSAPFVEIGQRVDEATELCLIEVMKLFTTLPAGVAGVVRSVFAKDGDLVEFGQPLFVIDPNA
jgi:acetyl-CoA carboxylase biotin carboxyl carrier protein